MELFFYLNKKKIKYVVWKNSNLIDKFFEGKENLDILIDYNEDELDKILSSFKWVEFKNLTINHKKIKHYYLLMQDRILHIHLYFDLITGDSLSKDYIFDKDVLFEHFFYDKKYNIKILNYDIQKFLFFVRLIIKNSSIFGYLLYRKQIDYYQQEFIFLNQSSKKISNIYFLPSKLINMINKHSSDEIFIPSFIELFIYCLKIRKYRRINFLHKNYIILIAIIKNIFLKKIFKRKMTLKNSKIISIVGPDGSGKSTLIKYLYDYFNFTNVRIYNIAKPYPIIIIKLVILYKNFFINKNQFIDKKKNIDLNNKNTIFFLLKSVILSFLRYRISIKMKKDLNKGYLIFCNRYISVNLGDINGPRIITKNNFLETLFGSIEKYFYKKIFTCDYEVRLNADIKTCLSRNENRNKDIKKNANEIIDRYNLFLKSYFKTNKIFIIENNNSFESAKIDILNTINEILSFSKYK